MKVYCLSSDAAKPCFVVSFKEQLVMLDCGLSAQSLLHFLPLPPAPAPRLADLPPYAPPHQHDPKLYAELRQVNGRVLVASEPEWGPPLDSVVPFEQLDAILISNYSCMLALPFVTEGTGFKGHVYATEPTLQIGRFYLEELLAWVSAAGGGAPAAKRWKEVAHTLPPPLCDAVRVRSWRRLPPAAAVRAALARVTVLHYEQVTQLFGALTATPVSSGYCLGSANWVLRTPHEKLAYVGGSSTLTTHPRPINQHALKNADVLLLAALTQTPAHNPDHALGDLCVAAASTLRGGGAVLVPVFAAGLLYDLLECLSAHLEAAGLCNVPLFVVGPAADASLAYSNILAEWLSGGKQARVYLPDEPFPHAALARAGRLRHAANIHDEAFASEFRQPCVVFCGHPSLRFGPAVHFMQLWATSPQHAVIFTEPDFPYQDALAPYQPLQMKAHYCPIDTALNYAQATKLVRELRARELLLPEQYRQLSVPATLLRRGSVAAPALRRRVVRATLPASLATKLVPRDLPPLRAAPLAAELVVRDSILELAAAPSLGGVTPVPRVAWGGVDSEALTRALAAGGLGGGARGAAGAGGSPAGSYTLHLARHDTLLHVERTATHVFCEGDERARQKARDAVLSCLSTL